MCWLFHSWTKWSEPKKGEATKGNIGALVQIVYQDRTCACCNEYDWRLC